MSQISVTKDRLWRGGKISNRLSRFRHFRGHGVHSPYVYSIVRKALMFKQLRCNNMDHFEKLMQLTTKQSAVEIANIAAHCNFGSLGIDCCSESGGMIICSDKCPEREIEQLANYAATHGTAIVIISPYNRLSLCNALLKGNLSTSIDRFNYLIFLNNHLPKQHFKL